MEKNTKNYLIIGVILILAFIGFILFYRSSQPAPTTTTEKGTPPVSGGTTVTTKNPARVVFAVSDTSASLDTIQSIFLTVNEVRVHSATKRWIVVSQTPKQYDLLLLRREGKAALLADFKLDAGTYDQMRLSVSKVQVVKKTGESVEAKLPSKELKITGDLIVEARGNSGVLFDFVAAKSLHTTGSGKFIFAPAMKVKTLTSVTSFQILPNERIHDQSVEFVGGNPKFIADLGMDENGIIKINFVLDPAANLEIVKDTIRIIPKGENQASLKVGAEAALDLAIQSGKLDSALSIRTVTRNGKLVWQIVGLKNTEIAIVYIDVATGAVVETE